MVSSIDITVQKEDTYSYEDSVVVCDRCAIFLWFRESGTCPLTHWQQSLVGKGFVEIWWRFGGGVDEANDYLVVGTIAFFLMKWYYIEKNERR